MQIKKLYTAIAETGATHFQVGEGDILSIESKEYEERKDHFIKGGFTLEDDYVRGRKILRCAKIDKEVTITINRPVSVNGEKLEEKTIVEEMLEDTANEVRSFVVYHKPSGSYTGKDLKRRDVPAWSDSVFTSFKNEFKESFNIKDFVLVVINWEDKNIKFENFE